MRYIIIILLFLILLVVATFPIDDPDIWMHLKIGKWMVENRKILEENPFLSYMPTGGWQRWISYQWLSQIIFFIIYSAWGVNGLIAFKTLMILLSFILLFSIGYKRKNYLLSILVMILSIFTAQTRFLCLPELFSLFFTSVYFFILYKNSQKETGLIFILPLLQAIWVNTHIYFSLGLAMIFLYLIDCYLLKKDIKRLIIIGILSSLVCLLNPNGFKGAIVALKTIGALKDYPIFSYNILELQPLFQIIQNFKITSVLFFCIILAGLTGISFLLNLKRINIGHIFLWLGLLSLSLKFRRVVGIFALVSMPVTVLNLNLLSLEYKRKYFEPLFLIGLVFLLFSSLNRFDLPTANLRRFGLGISDTVYPKKAVDFIQKVDLPGNVFNNIEIGGYFTWRLFPQKKAFIDTTTGFYGAVLFQDYIKTLTGEIDIEGIVKKYNINYFLLLHTHPSSGPLIKRLFDEDWKIIYLDDVAVIFIREIMENQIFIMQYGIGLDKEGPFNIALYEQDAQAYFRLGEFFLLIGRLDLAEIEYKKALEFRPDFGMAHFRLGKLYYERRLFKEAMSVFRKVVDLHPFSFEGHYYLGLSFAQSGFIEDSIREFKIAVLLKPKNPMAHYNLAVAYASRKPPQIILARKHLVRVERLGYEPDPMFIRHLEDLEESEIRR